MADRETSLKGMAAVLEKGRAASRELDCAIGVAIGRFTVHPPRYEGGDVQYSDGNAWPGQAGDMLVPRYTDSMDAALTLLPAHGPDCAAFWRVGNDGEGGDPSLFKAEVLIARGLISNRQTGVALTAPMALCIAALKTMA
ncbi:hypothetical protein [Ferrovibrio terrae]|uniref:hypothetical protein n=1 Tax=Ferrovibrio terrae TaxID=2594003 RepID=UPI0031383951